jgi:hypothetical protein
MTEDTLLGRRSAGKILSLVSIGIASELIYVLYFLRQFPLSKYYRSDLTLGDITHSTHPALLIFVLLTLALFALFGLACWLISTLDDRVAFWTVLGFSLVFVITLLFVYPFSSTDMFSYINQSRVLVHYHHNPMITPPSAFPHDRQMYRAFFWRRSPTPYGPLGVILDATPTVVTRENVLGTLIGLKLLFSAFAFGAALVAYRFLREFQPRFALLGMALISWNPLVLIETTVNGHNDAAMMCVLVLAIFAMSKRMPVLAASLVVLSALVKYSSIVVLPLFLVYGFWQQPTNRARFVYVAESSLTAAGIVILAYAPFWHSFHAFVNGISAQTHRYSDSFPSLILDLLRFTPNWSALVGWLIFIGAYLLALDRSIQERPQELAKGCFLALLGFAAFGLTNDQVWYALWPVMAIALVPYSREAIVAIVLSAGATLSIFVVYFLGVWNPGNVELVDVLSFLVMFVPALLVYAALTLRRLSISQNPRDLSIRP